MSPPPCCPLPFWCKNPTAPSPPLPPIRSISWCREGTTFAVLSPTSMAPVLQTLGIDRLEELESMLE